MSVSPVSRIAVILAISCALLSPVAHGSITEGPCAAPNLRTNVRPHADGPPVRVTVGIRKVDLLEIRDVDQTLTVDLAIMRRWTDPRLAHLEGCAMSLEDIWFPELVLTNSGRLFERWPQEAAVGVGGMVTYLQRTSGNGSTLEYLRLRD